MKNALKIIPIAFIAGLAGAYVYVHFLMERPSFSEAGVHSVKTTTDSSPDSGTLQFISQAEEAEATKGAKILSGNYPLDFSKASDVSTKSVVYIKTTSEAQYATTWMDFFFGERSAQTISTGSGVIYSKDGYVITNNHVIRNSDNVEVMVGKRGYKAELLGADPSSDLAVLKIEAKNLPAIPFGSSGDVKVGEWVLAVGNPFNLTSTVTAGIVSAKGRELNIMKSNFPIESFIQTDAAINPGNSGGALVNLEGELVGINTAILSKTGSYAGYGFAVPSDIVKKVVNDLIKYSEVQKAFFGGDVLDIDDDIVKKLSLKNYDGVVLSYVQTDGAAAKAGLERGDVILKLDNKAVNSRSEFEELLTYHSPGDKLNVIYRKGNKIVSSDVVLTNKEGTTEVIVREVFTSRALGADFERVPKVERDLLKIKQGVRIVKVRSGFIRQMELPEGFIITSINKIPIDEPETLTDILQKIRGRVIVEGVNKRGQRQYYRYYF